VKPAENMISLVIIIICFGLACFLGGVISGELMPIISAYSPKSWSNLAGQAEYYVRTAITISLIAAFLGTVIGLASWFISKRRREEEYPYY